MLISVCDVHDLLKGKTGPKVRARPSPTLRFLLLAGDAPGIFLQRKRVPGICHKRYMGPPGPSLRNLTPKKFAWRGCARQRLRGAISRQREIQRKKASLGGCDKPVSAPRSATD